MPGSYTRLDANTVVDEFGNQHFFPAEYPGGGLVADGGAVPSPEAPPEVSGWLSELFPAGAPDPVLGAPGAAPDPDLGATPVSQPDVGMPAVPGSLGRLLNSDRANLYPEAPAVSSPALSPSASPPPPLRGTPEGYPAPPLPVRGTPGYHNRLPASYGEMFANDVELANRGAAIDAETSELDKRSAEMGAEQARLKAEEAAAFAAEDAKDRQAALERSRERIAGIQQKADELGKTQVDPSRFWHDQSGFSKAMWALGAMAGGLLQVRRGIPNTALNMLNDAIERDIDAQKANLATRRAALSDEQRAVDALNQSDRDEIQDRAIAYQLRLDALAKGYDAKLATLDPARAEQKRKAADLIRETALSDSANKYGALIIGQEQAKADKAMEQRYAIARIRAQGEEQRKTQKAKDDADAARAVAKGPVVEDTSASDLNTAGGVYRPDGKGGRIPVKVKGEGNKAVENSVEADKVIQSGNEQKSYLRFLAKAMKDAGGPEAIIGKHGSVKQWLNAVAIPMASQANGGRMTDTDVAQAKAVATGREGLGIWESLTTLGDLEASVKAFDRVVDKQTLGRIRPYVRNGQDDMVWEYVDMETVPAGELGDEARDAAIRDLTGTDPKPSAVQRARQAPITSVADLDLRRNLSEEFAGGNKVLPDASPAVAAVLEKLGPKSRLEDIEAWGNAVRASDKYTPDDKQRLLLELGSLYNKAWSVRNPDAVEPDPRAPAWLQTQVFRHATPPVPPFLRGYRAFQVTSGGGE